MKPDLPQQVVPEIFSWRLPAVAFPLPQVYPINRQPQQSRQALADVAPPMTTVIEQALATWPDHLLATQPFDIESAISQLVRQVIVQSLFGAVGAEAPLENVGSLLRWHEMTSRGLVWALRFLAREPIFHRRVRQEVHQVVGRRIATNSDLEVLFCTRMLCQEALRWQAYPFITVAGLLQYVRHPLPSGQRERSSLLSEQSARSALQPTGYGCELALLTSQLVLAMILQRYANLSLLGFSA